MGIKIGLANDLHIFSSIQTCPKEELAKWINSCEHVILNGDIIDLAYCPKKQVREATEFAMLLNDNVKKKAQLDKGISEWLEGNHSLYKLSRFLGLKSFKWLGDGRYFFHHGHRFCWTEQHVDDFMSKEPGAGWIKGTVGVHLVDLLRKMSKDRPKNMEILAVDKLKLENPALVECHFGHNHPENPIVFHTSGVKNTVWDRGFHEIELDI